MKSKLYLEVVEEVKVNNDATKDLASRIVRYRWVSFDYCHNCNSLHDRYKVYNPIDSSYTSCEHLKKITKFRQSHILKNR